MIFREPRMKYFLAIISSILIASSLLLAQDKTISYTYYASNQRATRIKNNYLKVETGMTLQQVKAILGEPDETLPLYEPKIKNPKQIGHTAWYLIQRKTDNGSVNDKDEKLVRLSYDLNWKVSGIDHWGFDGNKQSETDYWCPKVAFAGKAADMFTLKKCEYISGITVELVYNGSYSYPSKLKFTLLDSDGNILKSDQTKHVFGPQHLEKGQFGIFTIQHTGSDNPSKIIVEGVWVNK